MRVRAVAGEGVLQTREAGLLDVLRPASADARCESIRVLLRVPLGDATVEVECEPEERDSSQLLIRTFVFVSVSRVIRNKVTEKRIHCLPHRFIVSLIGISFIQLDVTLP